MISVWRLAMRGLAFHWCTHLAVALGAAVGIAVIIGALGAGDSVRTSLNHLQSIRLGNTQLALTAQERFVRSRLSEELSHALEVPTAGVLMLPGVAVAGFGDSGDSGNSQRIVSGVQVIGVDDAFWSFSPQKPHFGPVPKEQVILNQALAARLGAAAGDTILLRVPRPSFLPRDMPLSSESDAIVAMHVRVQIVADDREFGRFGLQPQQVSPLNAFVSLPWLSEQAALEDRVNLILMGAGKNPISVETADAALRKVWDLGDMSCELRDRPSVDVFELRSDRIFIEPAIINAVQNSSSDLTGVLTYFVNELRVGERSTPYSMVCALGDVKRSTTATLTGRGKQMYTATSIIPADMTDDQIFINQWLADDLGAKVGDALEMKYFIPGSGRELLEQGASFVIRGILPMDGPAGDRTLMPDFPGISGAENCRDWDPSLPLDMKKVRDKDETYWKHFKGTPKAFVTLNAGRKMWSNRFGEMTAMRVPRFKKFRDRLRDALRADLNPASVGLQIVAVREEGKAAAKGAVDFGGLFLGLSGFLIIASLTLTGLLFNLAVEQRSREYGALRAMGLKRGLVLRVVAIEMGCVMLAAGIAGVILGMIDTRLIMAGLSGVWSGAVGQTLLVMHVKLTTLIIGLIAGIFAAVAAMMWATRDLFRRPITSLLRGELPMLRRLNTTPAISNEKIKATSQPWNIKNVLKNPMVLTASIFGLLALGLASASFLRNNQNQTTTFFAAGGLLLAAGLLLSVWLLWRFSGQLPAEKFSFNTLALGAATRRRGRSLATIMTLACGVFLLVVVGANRKDASLNSTRRDSGTGGFLLFAQTTMPVMEDMNQPMGRQKLGIKRGALDAASVVPVRVRDGQDASCLNLNRASQPTLWGVAPALLAGRKAFPFSSSVHVDDAKLSSPWLLLDAPVDGDAAIPVIGDEATVLWGLGKSLGDRLSYVDERGKTFEVRIVGLLSDSMLQGVLIMSKSQLEQHYPSVSGHRVFLVDGPEKESAAISQAMQKGLRDLGVEVMPASKRLANFQAVENTYLSIFQSLGALGLLLGSVGLGAVVMRNVFERRGELAMLRAVGFSRRRTERLILMEHLLLLGMGLGVGTIAGLAAVLPSLKWNHQWGAIAMMVFWLTLITCSAIGFTAAAGRLAVSGVGQTINDD